MDIQLIKVAMKAFAIFRRPIEVITCFMPLKNGCIGTAECDFIVHFFVLINYDNLS